MSHGEYDFFSKWRWGGPWWHWWRAAILVQTLPRHSLCFMTGRQPKTMEWKKCLKLSIDSNVTCLLPVHEACACQSPPGVVDCVNGQMLAAESFPERQEQFPHPWHVHTCDIKPGKFTFDTTLVWLCRFFYLLPDSAVQCFGGKKAPQC